jgi:cytochrome d ubiquinol oxidase subunit II
MFDYETLRIIWWGILLFLVCGFTVMDGFDLGIGMLLPFLGKTDDERRVMLNAIGPTWEGNQTWLITLGGISFGAWSLVYATVFSGLYTGMLVLLFGLFLRPVGFDYRSKLAHTKWRTAWDWALFLGGLIPSLVLSLAVGNVIQGLPFELDQELRSHYLGSFWGLFNPFGLLCVLVGCSLLCLHGAAFLYCRTEANLAERARKVIILSSMVFAVCFGIAGLWLAFGIDGYRISSAIAFNDAVNPLAKSVETGRGLWFDNYTKYPWLMLAPVFVFVATCLVPYFASKRKSKTVFVLTSVMVIATLTTTGGSMFPFILPSSMSPSSSLTVWDASASRYTLQLLFYATLLLMPMVMAYTAWVYRVMKGKVTVADIQNNQHTLY